MRMSGFQFGLRSGCRRFATENAHAQAGARERMPPHQIVRQAQLFTQHAYLVFVQILQRLYHQTGVDHVLHRLHAVVVRLDVIGMLGATGLNGIRVDGPLPQHPAVLHADVHFVSHALLHV